MRESVRTRDMGGCVDIQVGSRIYLSVSYIGALHMHLGGE